MAGYSPRQILYQCLPQCSVILKITYWIFRKLRLPRKQVETVMRIGLKITLQL